ncbi:MAG: hypothetical protein LBS68_01215 [Puniceicoccales bacterium]|nr:hypothetical protein [Puniceicoccales bacterium]
MGSLVLAGGLSEGEEPFAMYLGLNKLVQITTVLRSPSARSFDRGNRTVELRFSVLRRHPSVLAATKFLLSHGASLAALGGTATIVPENASQITYYLTAAALRSIHGAQEGTTTTHVYVLVGGGLTTEFQGN